MSVSDKRKVSTSGHIDQENRATDIYFYYSQHSKISRARCRTLPARHPTSSKTSNPSFTHHQDPALHTRYLQSITPQQYPLIPHPGTRANYIIYKCLVDSNNSRTNLIALQYETWLVALPAVHGEEKSM
jgi:hypothetical protein